MCVCVIYLHPTSKCIFAIFQWYIDPRPFTQSSPVLCHVILQKNSMNGVCLCTFILLCICVYMYSMNSPYNNTLFIFSTEYTIYSMTYCFNYSLVLPCITI